jgi:hypothetical protein
MEGTTKIFKIKIHSAPLAEGFVGFFKMSVTKVCRGDLYMTPEDIVFENHTSLEFPYCSPSLSS